MRCVAQSSYELPSTKSALGLDLPRLRCLQPDRSIQAFNERVLIERLAQEADRSVVERTLPVFLNQFDLGFRKVFKFREKYTLMGEAQIFNLFNVSTPLTESYSLGSSVAPFLSSGPGGAVSVVENPRMLRLNVQFKF